MHLSTWMLANEKLEKISGSAPREKSHARTLALKMKKWRITMTGLKTLIAVALVSMTAVTSASAQLPSWAATNPDSFQAQYPDRDVLNGGARTPAGSMGLELPGGAAPVFGANNAYAATGPAASSCVRFYHSYDPASGTFLGYDGRRHACE
jgi:BA14K-like protein